eukprot:7828291-Alexandrium_andersonii.AAC.1
MRVAHYTSTTRLANTWMCGDAARSEWSVSGLYVRGRPKPCRVICRRHGPGTSHGLRAGGAISYRASRHAGHGTDRITTQVHEDRGMRQLLHRAGAAGTCGAV